MRPDTTTVGTGDSSPFLQCGQRAYFGDNFPKLQPGETTADTIRRAYVEDIELAQKWLPRLNPISVRNALTHIDGHPGDALAAIFKAMHDQAWVAAEVTKGEA